MMKKAFTLIEVNLAMLIMAGGILSIVGLYAFGYRENRQSREDVAATALADAVISPLMMAITATNLKWSAFRQEFHFPAKEGWGAYFDNDGIVSQNPDGKARSAFTQTMNKMQGAAKGTFDCQTSFPSVAAESSGLLSGLVVMHEQDSPIVRIGFRATSQPGTLLAMPLFYTEARFQGLANE